MSRERIIQSPAYWVGKIQIALYNCAEKFMESHSMNRTQLAAHLGVSKGYISQLLNGDYDHKLSKLVELALSFGYVPTVEFKPVAEVMEKDFSFRSSISVNAGEPVSFSYVSFEPVMEKTRSLSVSISQADYPRITSSFEKIPA